LKLGVQWDTIAVFFLNFVPLHIESPYNFGGKKPSAESKWACWIVSELFEEKQICAGFSSLVYICIAVYQSIKRGVTIVIPLTDLTATFS
jgi:hypothetical protein